MRAALLLAFATALQAQQVCGPTPLYGVCDVIFDASKEEVTQLQAEVKSPKFKTSLVPAFFDGGRRWVIRFAPVDPGRYEFRVTSNVERFANKTGSVDAQPSDHPGFLRPANLHHFIHPETLKPHLWVGGLNHVRERLPATEEPSAFQAFEQKVRAHNAAGRIVDVVLAQDAAEITRRFPLWQDRQRWLSLVTSRLAAFDVTWLLVERFEGVYGARELLRETGQFLRKIDPYNHPRSAGAQQSSAPMLPDQWMDYISIGAANPTLPAVEHQFFARPFVTMAKAASGEPFRKQLWNATMSGQYPSFDGGDPGLLKIWSDFFQRTRFWELEPYFDVDGGRALALDDVEYIVYIEKPSGPIEVLTAKHGYDVYWIDPATGESQKGKDHRGERFVGEAPTSTHDWILHLSRDGRKEGMARSYKFVSRDNLQQEPEVLPAKVPFEIVEPSGDELSLSAPANFAIKVKRETRATRSLDVVWTADVVPEGQGYRVVGTGAKGKLELPAELARKFPAVLNLRVSILNANGKAYAIDKVYRLVP